MDALILRPFHPIRWAPGPHAQTLFARALRSADGPEYVRERIETPDGDFVDIDWGPEPEAGAPLVLLVHGLEGNAGRRYVRNVARELLARGVQPVGLNLRGCSGEPNRLPRFYHSGDTADPRFVLEQLAERFPGRALGAFGFSLGGNILLKMLGERADGGTGLVRALAVMSVPFDLGAGCALLERSRWGRAYTGYFMRSLRRKVRAKEILLGGLLDLDAVYAARTIWEFDDRATAPLNGYRDAAHYYGEASSVHYLGGIRAPTLLMHAVDDPFLPAEAIPRAEADANPALTLALQRTGGHVGFLEGSPRSPHFWADEEGAAFLAHELRA